jgi:hypothetical protein
MGMPIRVASITVVAAAATTAREKLFSVTMLSGTKPFPVKVLSSACANRRAVAEPRKVVTVAQSSARL